jgi:hypothetical protein
MALEFASALRDAMLDAIESHISTSPIFQVRTGSPPADLGTADSGTLLADMTLPSDWMAAASGGAKAKTGTWQDAAADASGTPGHFRIKTSGGTAKIQGTAGVGSGDLSFDAAITIGGTVTITTFTLTAGNSDT